MIDILKFIFLILTVFVCAYTDLKYRVVKNKVVAISIIVGILLNFIENGFNGFLSSAIGVIIPFVVLFVLFAIRAFGAGDIKLVCAIGAIMGIDFVINNFIFSVFIGFLMIILSSMIDKNTVKRLKDFVLSIFNMFLSRTISDSISPKDKKGIPFAVAIFIATIVQVLSKVEIF
ncbi:A24 family peptidase [Clostridium chrysemydis]|uniref:A24 family peptidase n=1 Tax=Clostridium chrysemydis TaxID=2665504 RepID=UPI003F2C92BE